MTRVNLDDEPSVVREFVRALAASTEGVLLEFAGHAVACVVPPPQLRNGVDRE